MNTRKVRGEGERANVIQSHRPSLVLNHNVATNPGIFRNRRQKETKTITKQKGLIKPIP